jgi:hypothetical protein
MTTLRFEYDPFADVLTIEGVKYAGEVFRGLGLTPPGKWVRIVDRRDGVVTLTTGESEDAHRAAADAALERAAKHVRDGFILVPRALSWHAKRRIVADSILALKSDRGGR